MEFKREQFAKLCESLAEEIDFYDLILVGDGSGTVSDKPAGWCAVSWWNKPTGDLICPDTEIHRGSCSHGTNNFAELMPYIQCLWYYIGIVIKHKRPKVLIVSDSEVTVKCGNGEYGRNKNLHLWSQIDWLVDYGFDIFWRHVKRNSNPISAFCDEQAGICRKKLDNNKV